MALSSGRTSATTTATLIVTADADGSTVAAYAATAVDYGGASVTTGAGFSPPTGSVVAIDLDAGESLYAITASGTVSVHWIKNRA